MSVMNIQGLSRISSPVPDLQRQQLPPASYGRLASRLLRRYLLAPDHPSKLRLVGWFYRMAGRRRILVECRHDFVLAVDHRDYVQRTIFETRDWEPEIGAFLKEELRADDVFYDIGANIGYFSCLAATVSRARVFAFEPDPLTATVLRENLKLNSLSGDQVCVTERGVSDSDGEAEFHRFSIANVGKSGFEVEGGVAAFPVSCCTLDCFVLEGNHPSPTVMKIDTEGWEAHVLAGGARLFARHPPRAVVFEAYCDAEASLTEVNLRRFFENHGYEIRHLPRASGRIEPNENFVARLSR